MAWAGLAAPDTSTFARSTRMIAAAHRFPSSVASCRIRSASSGGLVEPALGELHPREQAERPAQATPVAELAERAGRRVEALLGLVAVAADERDPGQVLQRPRLTAAMADRPEDLQCLVDEHCGARRACRRRGRSARGSGARHRARAGRRGRASGRPLRRASWPTRRGHPPCTARRRAPSVRWPSAFASSSDSATARTAPRS